MMLSRNSLSQREVVPVEDLRVSAISALKHYGPDAEEAIPAIEAMLHDSSERIQNVAEWALDEMRY